MRISIRAKALARARDRAVPRDVVELFGEKLTSCPLYYAFYQLFFYATDAAATLRLLLANGRSMVKPREPLFYFHLTRFLVGHKQKKKKTKIPPIFCADSTGLDGRERVG